MTSLEAEELMQLINQLTTEESYLATYEAMQLPTSRAAEDRDRAWASVREWVREHTDDRSLRIADAAREYVLKRDEDGRCLGEGIPSTLTWTNLRDLVCGEEEM